MLLLKTKNYKKSSASIPKKEKSLLLKQEKLLTKDMFHPGLHTKKLKGFGSDRVYSFRITRAYRGILRLSEENIVLFAIGHRKDIYEI
jgi:mRNA-degrading endonuclease RelE of RelBE toxin-antitoxin system